MENKDNTQQNAKANVSADASLNNSNDQQKPANSSEAQAVVQPAQAAPASSADSVAPATTQGTPQPATANVAPAPAAELKGYRKATRIAGIVVGVVLCVVSIPVIIFNCIIIVQGLVNPNELPSIGGKAPLVVLTDSMYPTIIGGDLIIIDKDVPQNVKADDVISYFDPAATTGTPVVTHRVLEVVNTDGQLSFKTKGDANVAEDKYTVPASKFIGKFNGVRFLGLGNLCMWLKSVPGIVTCVGVPLLILVAYDIIRRKIYAKKQQKTEDELRQQLDQLKASQASQNS